MTFRKVVALGNSCFNRTFMELKGRRAWTSWRTRHGFNRTFMELKGASTVHVQWTVCSFNRTFMELKVGNDTARNVYRGFQSHLYGIESSERVEFTGIMRCFNRTFMELKESCHVPRYVVQERFNRTFMELKEEHRGALHRPATSFNRTFMELKVHISTLLKLWNSFQSHLYGIESVIHIIVYSSFGFVSIAPLWNWKLGVAPSAVSAQSRFNRTFMELKVFFISLSLWAASVSIAPLWNWKIAPNRTKVAALCFNRTFMELKDWMRLAMVLLILFQSHLYGIESHVEHVAILSVKTVSIAPLWNWKTSGATIGLSLVPFQSHLYGIESVWLLLAFSNSTSFNRTFMELKASSKQTDKGKH